MRIVYAFMVLVAAVILWLLPVTEGIYDYRTDLRTDTFNKDTTVNLTAQNVTLLQALYDSDIGSVNITSNLSTDAPFASSYNATRKLYMTGLTFNATRTLEVTYAVDALNLYPAISTLMDILPYLWFLIIVCFPLVGLFAIFTGRN